MLDPEKKRARRRRWRAKNKEKRAEEARLYRKRHPEKTREISRRYYQKHAVRKSAEVKDVKNRNILVDLKIKRQKQRLEALEIYGRTCYCCGESIPLLLALDHINGDGNLYRKKFGNVPLHLWARRNNWPPIFRVACHSCNQGAHLNGGICPHQEREMEKIERFPMIA